MAHHLTMALIDSIFTLHQRGWSQRRIARELRIHRDTVARYLQEHTATAASPETLGPSAPADPLADSKPAIAPIGSEEGSENSKPAIAPIGSEVGADDSKPAIAPIGSEEDSNDSKPAIAPIGSLTPAASAEAAVVPLATLPNAGRASDCEPWRAIILGKRDQGLSAQRIFQDLVADHGFPGSYYSVRRFVRHLDHDTPLPCRRIECAPGEEVQIDFGTGAPILHDGKRRRTHVFRMVLSHSRKAYSEVVYRQTTDAFLGCLENAFVAFGGVPQRGVLDNLKAGVQVPDWYDPELNPKLSDFARHYGIVMLPTRPYTPQHKGKVERGVAYVQDNALKGRTFTSLEEQNAFLRHWELTVADTRVHGTIRQQVGKLFAEVERPALAALPAERFPFFHEGQRTVHRDGHVEVDRAYYSAPPEYLGRRLWVRWDTRLVRLLNERFEQVAVHVRQEPGRFSTRRQDIPREKTSGVERGAVWLLGRIRLLGTQAAAWAEAVIAQRGVEGVRVLQGLLSLASRHAASALDRACGIALSCDAYRLRTIRALIDRDAPQQEALPFVEEHPLIRPLTDYGDLVHRSFHRES